MTVNTSGSANGAAAGGGRNNGTAPQCVVVPRPAVTTTTTTTFRRAGMPSPKEEGDDGLRRPPQRVTHSFNEEFFTMAALCLASAFAFFCCQSLWSDHNSKRSPWMCSHNPVSHRPPPGDGRRHHPVGVKENPTITSPRLTERCTQHVTSST